MKIFKTGLAIASMLFIALSCTPSNEIELFNGQNFDNWSIFVSDDTPEDAVFWVEENLLNVSGIPHGYIKTAEAYENYKLHLEWRWVAEPANSGVLLHVSGEDMIWPNCIEAQLKTGQAGDFVLIGTGAGLTHYDTARIIESEEDRYLALPKFLVSSEKAPGEWNEYDITVDGGAIELIVNGSIQNKGVDATKTRGKIAIQSEGGPMQFRNITLTKL